MHLKNGTNELHFYYGSDGKPAFVRIGTARFAYVYNLQGDVIALTNNSGSVVVAYSYDAWGKPLGVTGTLAATLGRLNPFRYRGYVWDEETGLYYLRSRYYRCEWGRFVNEDEQIRGNVYNYCDDDPIGNADNDGHDSDIGHYTTDDLIDVLRKAPRWGTADAEEKIPVWILINGIHQMVREKWKYRPEIGYGYVDCIGGIRFIAQQFYRLRRFMDQNIKAKSSSIAIYDIEELHVIDKDHLDEIPAGAVLFSYRKGHMGYYLGDFNNLQYCLAETRYEGDRMRYRNLENRLYNEKDGSGFYYWAKLKCVDYHDCGPMSLNFQNISD